MDAPQQTLTLHWLDGVIVGVYLLMLAGIGYYHARRQKSLEDYFLAGRSVGWLAVGVSLMAALNSGVDYVMVPSGVIQYGLVLLVQNLTWILLYPYVFFVTLPLYRRLEVYSAYEYLEQRFNIWVRSLTAGIFILWRMGWMATALYVPCLAISAATGGAIPLKLTIVLLGVFVTGYTMLGGIKAVVWNDVAQFCVMFTGLAATIAVVLYHVPGGISEIAGAALQVGQSLPTTSTPANGDILSQIGNFFTIPLTAVGMYVSMMVTRVATYTSDQVMVQRFQTTRTIRDARKGFLITALSDSLWMTMLAVVGLALFAYFQTHPLPDFVKANPDRIFPYFMTEVFPPGLTGLVIAAIFAASLSSVDSAINSLSSVVMVDFYHRLYLGSRNKSSFEEDHKHQVRISRIITILIGVIGVSLACNVDKLGTVLEISNLIINSFTGAILGIFVLGMFARRANSTGVFVGGFAGTLVTLYTIFWSSGVFNDVVIAGFTMGDLWPSGRPISFLWPAPFGFLATVIVGCLVSLVTPAAVDPVQDLTWYSVTQRRLLE